MLPDPELVRTAAEVVELQLERMAREVVADPAADLVLLRQRASVLLQATCLAVPRGDLQRDARDHVARLAVPADPAPRSLALGGDDVAHVVFHRRVPEGPHPVSPVELTAGGETEDLEHEVGGDVVRVGGAAVAGLAAQDPAVALGRVDERVGGTNAQPRLASALEVAFFVVLEHPERQHFDPADVHELERVHFPVVAPLSHPHARVVAELAQPEEVVRTDIEADVAVEVELALCERAIDQLQIARRDDALAAVRHLVLADAERRVLPVREVVVPVQDRRLVGRTVGEALVARRQRELDLELVVLVEHVTLELQSRAANLQSLGYVVGRIVVVDRVEELGAQTWCDLEAIVGAGDHQARSGLELHAGGVDLRGTGEIDLLLRHEVRDTVAALVLRRGLRRGRGHVLWGAGLVDVRRRAGGWLRLGRRVDFTFQRRRGRCILRAVGLGLDRLDIRVELLRLRQRGVGLVVGDRGRIGRSLRLRLRNSRVGVGRGREPGGGRRPRRGETADTEENAKGGRDSRGMRGHVGARRARNVAAPRNDGVTSDAST